MPKIPDLETWQQAELLLQPTYIRVVDNLRRYVEDSGWDSSFEEVTDPYPGHVICLQHGDTVVRYNLWSLCYQVCFVDYEPNLDTEGTEEVQVDQSLLDEETGDVDWQQLEAKTQILLATLFQQPEHGTQKSGDAESPI